MIRRHAHWILAALLALATSAVFMRVVDGEFLRWDDDLQIPGNVALGPLTLRGVGWAFTDFETAARYIPLTLIGWMANISCAGKTPYGFHLVNLLLHSANMALVFLLVRRLLVSSGGGDSRRVILCAALGAAFWGLHPLRVEPVAWATTRTYCQATFFLLISAIAYLRAFPPEMVRPCRRRWFVLSLLAYAASLLSYPAGLGFVIVLLVLDVYPLRRATFAGRWWHDRSTRNCLLQKTPFALVAAGVLALALMARFHSSKVFPGAASLADFGLVPRLEQACYLWMYYAWRPWVPLSIAPVYTTLVAFTVTDPRFLLSVSGLVAVTLLLVAMRRRWPAALALWICHLALLAPMLGWTEHPHYPADRYSLVAGVLWAVAVGAAVCRLAMSNRYRAAIAACTALALAIGGLSIMTIRQIAVWHDSESLFTFMLERLGDDPYRADILMRRAVVRAGAGDADATEADLRSAVLADPRHLTARSLLGQVLLQRGKAGDAASVLAEGVVQKPDAAELRYLLAIALMQSGRDRDAATQLEQVLRQQPDDARARAALEAVRAKLQQTR